MYSVYLVDDEKLVLEKLTKTVPWLDNGFEVVGFNANPQTALAEITEMQPDVVFCDLRMPKMDGLQLIEKLIKNGVKADFVMLSAFNDFDACREFFRLEGIDYFLKPLDQDNAAEVLERISRKMAKKHHQTPSVVFVPSQSKSFDDLVAYVIANFNQKITLKDLSQLFNMNQNHICNMFSKHYESTLIIFITNLRMKEASRLMLETDTQLKEISFHCGYQSYHHFCAVFKTHFGKSPTEYREAGG
jgi:YesN/AraC family two-component response regulator